MTPERPAATCDGSRHCEAETHLHGCFADRGKCDEPNEHRSAANRQEFESVRDTLDTLALNLTNYGHTWSPELRTAYENAIAFLSRAASEPKATVKTKPGETTVTVDFRGGAA